MEADAEAIRAAVLLDEIMQAGAEQSAARIVVVCHPTLPAVLQESWHVSCMRDSVPYVLLFLPRVASALVCVPGEQGDIFNQIYYKFGAPLCCAGGDLGGEDDQCAERAAVQLLRAHDGSAHRRAQCAAVRPHTLPWLVALSAPCGS